MTECSRTMSLAEGSQVLQWASTSSPPGLALHHLQGPGAVSKGAVCSPGHMLGLAHDGCLPQPHRGARLCHARKQEHLGQIPAAQHAT